MIYPSRLISWYCFLFLSLVILFCFRKGASRLNATNTTGLDEYVDILQVQQLLLDSSSSIATSSSASLSTITAVPPATSTATSSAARHRPRVNIQKATDYSAAAIAAAASTTTANVSQVQGKGDRHFPSFRIFFLTFSTNSKWQYALGLRYHYAAPVVLLDGSNCHVKWAWAYALKMISITLTHYTYMQVAGHSPKKNKTKNIIELNTYRMPSYINICLW